MLVRDKIADDFIKLALKCGALRIGDFTLKSGRKSPYFMDVSMIAYAKQAKQLGVMYVKLALQAKCKKGTFLGLPYKGIPLAAIAASASSEIKDTKFCYGYIRETVKERGKKGWFGGIIYEGQPVILLDDVLTAGTAAKVGVEVCRRHEFFPPSLLVAFDRMERASDTDTRAASTMLQEDHGLTVFSLANANDLLRADIKKDMKEKISEHLDKYGAKNEPAPS